MSPEQEVEASTGGRRITLNPLYERSPLVVAVRAVESTLPCGFRVGWMDGTGSEDSPVESFDLDCGAGVGSSWLSLDITMKDGTRIAEIINMREVLPAWVEAAVAAYDAQKEATE